MNILTNITTILYLNEGHIWLASGIISIFYGLTILSLYNYLNKIDYVNEYKLINSNYIIKKKEENKDEKIDLLHEKPIKEITKEDEQKEKERIKFENEKILMKAKYLKNTTITNFLSSMILFISYSFGFSYGLINLFYTAYFDILYNNPTFLNHQDNLDRIIVMFIAQGFIWDIVAGMDFYPNLMRSRLLKNLVYTISTIYAYSKNNIKFMTLAYLSEFPDLLILAYIMCGIHIEDNKQKMIFSFYHFFFKIIIPIFSLYYIYANKLNLVLELQFVMAMKIWFEVCQFTIFMVDKYILNNDIKNDKQEKIE